MRTGSYGLAYQESADFYYIDRWSSIFTWGGTTVPQDREFVVIQKVSCFCYPNKSFYLMILF